MTSLHMICGLGPPPIKNPGYAYGSVRRTFERGARKFENNEDQNENFPAQNQVRFPTQK